MENYGDSLEITKINATDFEDMIKTPLLSKSSMITKSIIRNMAVQVCRIIDDKVTPTYGGDILCFVPGISNFFDLRDQIITYYKIIHKKEDVTDILEIVFLHSRFSEELKD